MGRARYHGTLSDRHRPGHHEQRAGVPRPASAPRGGGRVDITPLPRSPARRARRNQGADASAVVPLPARIARFGRRRHGPALGPVAQLRRRRVRPQPRRQGARPTRHFREVVAVPSRRRSLVGPAALERAARRAASFSRRGVGALPAPPGRKLELRDGEGSARLPAGAAGGGADRARVVRRRGPNADRRGGGQGGARKRGPAGGAAGGVLLLAGSTHPLAGGDASPDEARAWTLPGRRRRRRHHRLQPDRGRRGQGRTRVHSPGGRRPPAAGRRQHGPGAGQVRREQAARGRAAGRDAVRSADPGVPAGEGDAARPCAARQPHGDSRRPRAGGHRRHAARAR